MAIIEIQNLIQHQISTTIGTVPKGKGRILRVQTDDVPIRRALYDELEGLKLTGSISYDVLEDPDIRDEIEFKPFTIDANASPPIGTPSDGDYTDGKLPLVPITTIADAFDLVNIEFLNTVAAASKVGTPTTGDLTGTLPLLTPDTLIADAFQAYGLFNAAIAPAQPGTLVSQDLVVVGATQYSAKIPNDLSAAWDPLTSGQTITNLVVDGTFVLESADQANRFIAGLAGQQATAGSINLIEDTVVSETYSIVINGVGTIGRISVTDLSVFNTIWQKANAEFDIILSTEGRHRFIMQHTESGSSNEREVYFDSVNTAPLFSVAMSAVINTIVSNYLSGIEAAGINTTIDIAYTAASGIFTKTYHPTTVGQVSGNGHTASIDNPGSAPSSTDTFPIARTITLDVANQSSLSPQYTATIRKPDNTNAQSSNGIAKPVNTYGTVSTTKVDDFFDEARRIVLGSGTSSGTATSWTSSASLVNGNAQQRHSGTLQFPNSTDYPAFSGDQEYQRFIAKAAASTGALTNTGIAYTDIDPYGTGDLNILLELATEGIFFDLGQPVGSDNGTGSGDSRVNSMGARNDLSSSGSTTVWSVGIFSTANNTNEYRLIIIFRNGNHSITSISET